MIAFFDCTNGIAGDMIVASLIDAGIEWSDFQRELSSLNLQNFQLELSEVKRAHIRAKHFKVISTEKNPPARHLSEIIKIIDNSKLRNRVKNDAKSVFSRIAAAEAKVHDCEISQVHFHEVGALDSIVDIVGACVCLSMLNIDKVYYSKVAIGTGTIKCAHGLLPAPAPATSNLLLGSRLCRAHGEGEHTTPTGAAIVTALGEQLPDMPEFTLTSIGHGGGTRDNPDYPNILRVFLGNYDLRDSSDIDEITVISFNIDDMTGEHFALLEEELFAKGVLEVVKIPIYMKKSRPGIKVEVLVEIKDVDKIVESIFSQSSTFGVRLCEQRRYKLRRRLVTVELSGCNVGVKLGYIGGKLVQISPEFRDCKAVTEKTGENFKIIYARAIEKCLNSSY